MDVANQVKDTGYLLKHSFTVIGKDKDIVKPTVRSIIFSLIITTLLWGSIIIAFSERVFTGILLLLFTAVILKPYSSYYFIRQRAHQSWIVYNTITGKDIGYTDARQHANAHRGKWFFLAVIDIIVRYLVANGRNRGRGAMIAGMFLRALDEIWDLVSNYAIPAVVIEQKPLLELAPKLKELRKNVPATLVGVFGIDFGSNLFSRVFTFFSTLLLVAAFYVAYITAPPGTWFTINNIPFAWFPIVVTMYFITAVHTVLFHLTQGIKTIYFTIFYTSIERPKEIRKDMQKELTNYLLMKEAT